ncbi:N-formylglutamate amidohydrolase [Rhizobium halophytocola]|uniref:N-formylglutamate amidohydrolase n=1 Tax=Rhizobium halophytocola TaxID=735519 RepID=A0ABS4E370_9HYPH|nr:N-formylglutamate amidohydrolase [Rhizobium halophytocola]MBP1852382.1 putative N-formylglutamate amidohydrolase [Rhizobium halophytocola]
MLLRSDILTSADGAPVAVERVDASGPVLIVCEHASRRLPDKAGTLGLSSEALESHIAWDPGALAVARHMSGRLDASLIHQRFSRLIYDCNRPPDSASAMPEMSEIYDIPGNRDLSVAERYARTSALYVPFHDRIAAEIEARAGRGQATVLVTVHSFTPVYMGKSRAVEIGILHDDDSRLADAMLTAGEGNSDYRLGRNDPYGPRDGVTHTLRLHALPRGLMNVMIEVRNDLIANEADQQKAASYLSALLQSALSEAAP